MPKVADDTVMDSGLNGGIKSVCTRMCVISGAGLAINATVASIDAVRLAQSTMASGDFTIAAGAQRVLTVASKGPITPNGTGTPSHVTLDNGTKLIYQTTCTGSALTNGGPQVTFPAWTITIAGPT